MARSRGVDLVEVAPNAAPPVCRMMDYGKFRYEQSRRERDSRKNQHIVELKEIRIQPKIGGHDLETKARTAAKFLDGGDKVKFTVRFRGREMAHPDIGKGLLDALWEKLKTQSTVELPPRMEGRTMIMHLAPLKAKQSMAERESERSGRRAEGSSESTEAAEQEDTAMAAALLAATELNAESAGEADTALAGDSPVEAGQNEETGGEAKAQDAQGRGAPVQGDRNGPDHAHEAQQEP
jgi:translation initiation factor IF-3